MVVELDEVLYSLSLIILGFAKVAIAKGTCSNHCKTWLDVHKQAKIPAPPAMLRWIMQQ